MQNQYHLLRNYLKSKNLFSCWFQVWNSFSEIGDSSKYSDSLEKEYRAFDWELELLSREIVLNCNFLPPPQILLYPHFIKRSVGYIRAISESISAACVASADDAMRAMGPLIHQQAHWQDDVLWARMTRYLKILRYPKLRDLVEGYLGLQIADFYMLGIAVAGALSRKPGIVQDDYKQIPDIEPQTVDAFFSLVSEDVSTLRTQMQATQKYDHTWASSYNALRGKPLITSSFAPGVAFGLSQHLLLWRITEGIYYDLPRHDPWLNSAYGAAFHVYVGEVLRTVLPHDRFIVRDEKPYSMGKGKPRDGSDWRISDANAHVFVECKTKRMTLAGKSLSDTADLTKLGEFFVQNYKNITEARGGFQPDFVPNGLPMYNAVVTLENWRIFTPPQVAELRKLILSGLEKIGLSSALVDEIPYRLFDAQEFERFVQDMCRVGVFAAFEHSAVQKRGPYQELFPQELMTILPEAARQGLEMNIRPVS